MSNPKLVFASMVALACVMSFGAGCSSDDSSGGSSGKGGSGGSTGGSGGTSATGGSGGSTGGSGGAAGGGGTATGGAAGAGATGGAAGAGGGGGAAGAGGGGGCGGATPIALTVKNYLNWCSVSVAGGTAVSDAAQTVCVAAGAIDLEATALTGFKLGTTPWHDTDGDTGSGEQGTLSGSGQSQKSAAKKTVSSGAACAWVCCEFTAGGGCPTTDQCP
jgi:hypothetical protein